MTKNLLPRAFDDTLNNISTPDDLQSLDCTKLRKCWKTRASNRPYLGHCSICISWSGFLWMTFFADVMTSFRAYAILANLNFTYCNLFYYRAAVN